MSISLSLSISYQRRRPDTQGDRVEARIDSIALIVIGAVVSAIILLIVLPRILNALGLF